MTDGKSFWFSNKAFDSPRPGDQDTCLMTMTQIKQLFPPDSITIVGADDVDKVADYLGIKGKTDSEKLENLIKAIDELKEKVGIKPTIKDYGIDEKDFLDRLDDMTEQAFDDQCTGANPRYPLMSEIKQMYLNAYYGNNETV